MQAHEWQATVEGFLRDYIDAFSSNDGARIARTYNLIVQPLGAQSAMATLDWQMQREDGSLIRRWRQTYNFLQVGGQARILASTFHLT
jgi:hypothetical protein